VYDAIVVGARCAGAPTALLLARRGYRVLLLDRDTFPSDVISTHFIWPRGVARLRDWGLLDAVLATNCPPVPRSLTHVAGNVVEEVFAQTADHEFGLCPRRIVFDKLLIDAAVDAGVAFRQRFSVRGLIREDGRVVGISGRFEGGDVVERARVVIGADGLHSRIARLVGPEAYHLMPTLAAIYYSYWSGIPMDAVELYWPIPGLGGTIAMPTNNGQVVIGSAFPLSRLDEVRRDPEPAFLGLQERAAPGLWRRMRAGRRESPFRGMADLPYYARKPFGPGWALVGDAAYHVDPTLGYGISNAFRQIEPLVSALDDVFADRREFDAALGEFQRNRDRELRTYYARNLGVARLLDTAVPTRASLMARRPSAGGK